MKSRLRITGLLILLIGLLCVFIQQKIEITDIKAEGPSNNTLQNQTQQNSRDLKVPNKKQAEQDVESQIDTSEKLTRNERGDVLRRRLEAGRDVLSVTDAPPVISENKLFYAHGDILIDSQNLVKDEQGHVTAKLDEIRYWRTGVIPYTIYEMDPGPIKEAIKSLSEKTSWKFVERTSEVDYVVFMPIAEEGCHSYLGQRGYAQQIMLHESCTYGQILHELMHTLGFVHEQSREDRDNYLTVHWENVDPSKRDQFQKLPSLISQPTNTEFDYNSILLYPSHAFSMDGGVTLSKPDGSLFSANREELSELDRKKCNQLFDLKVDNYQIQR